MRWNRRCRREKRQCLGYQFSSPYVEAVKGQQQPFSCMLLLFFNFFVWILVWHRSSKRFNSTSQWGTKTEAIQLTPDEWILLLVHTWVPFLEQTGLFRGFSLVAQPWGTSLERLLSIPSSSAFVAAPYFDHESISPLPNIFIQLEADWFGPYRWFTADAFLLLLPVPCVSDIKHFLPIYPSRPEKNGLVCIIVLLQDSSCRCSVLMSTVLVLWNAVNSSPNKVLLPQDSEPSNPDPDSQERGSHNISLTSTLYHGLIWSTS